MCRTLFYLLITLILSEFPLYSQNIQSLEWQCFNASAIIHCEITSCEFGKIGNASFEKVEFKVKKIFKGGNKVKKGEMYFHTAQGGLSFRKHLKHDCILFVHFQKNKDDSYRIIPADKSPENSIIDFEDENLLVATSEFTVLQKKADVISLIKKTIEKENQLYSAKPDLKIKKHLVAVPEESELYKTLGIKGGAFLYVPDVLVSTPIPDKQ